jgi:Flp pilus assembly protein TadB
VTTAALLGAGTGMGLILFVFGVLPHRLSLADTIAALHPANTTAPTAPTAAPPGWAARVGRPGVTLLRRIGLPRPATLANLGICDRHSDVHLAEQAAAAAAGFVLPPTAAAVLALGGVVLPWPVPAWTSLLLAAGGFLLPDLVIRDEARRRRADLRAALSGLLDIAVISLAGGAGVEQALTDATDNPRTFGQHRLRRAIHAATLSRVPPWTTLGQLGADTAEPALVEFAAALSLAGTEGARVRATLTARAASLREHELADAEAQAASATEKMSLPIAALFGGFLLFLGYPALAAVLNAL